MIEKLKKSVDNEVVLAVLLIDLSKAFDCIPHDLIIAKLAAHGFDTNSLKLIHSYLSNRKQRVKIKRYIYVVPQSSMLVLCFLCFTLTSQVMQMITHTIQHRKIKRQ